MLETAKQRLKAQAKCLRRYNGEAEAGRVCKMFSTQPSKVYSQWQGNNVITDPTREEHMGEKASPMLHGKWI